VHENATWHFHVMYIVNLSKDLELWINYNLLTNCVILLQARIETTRVIKSPNGKDKGMVIYGTLSRSLLWDSFRLFNRTDYVSIKQAATISISSVVHKD